MPYVTETLNSLRGEEISRKQLNQLARQAEAEKQHHIADKITLLLRKHPGQKLFIIDASSKIEEMLTDDMLHGLHCEHDNDNKIHGLGKAVSAEQIYTMITERMVEMVKEANLQDYRTTWKQKGYLLPFNFVSKKRYRGINNVLLTKFGLLENPFFLTFNQIEDLGGTLKKGTRGVPVVYFTYLYKYERDGHDIASYDKEKFIGLLTEAGVKNPQSVANSGRIPILKYYNVFNGASVTGIDFDLDNFKNGYVETELPANEDNRLQAAEAIISHYPKPAPKIMHGGSAAFYRPLGDEVHIPEFVDFITAQDYYRTLFHELTHSTGSPERLARVKGKKFGDKAYAFEELVAEFGATFISAEAGIIWHSNSNHAAYLKSWNIALTHMKDDNRFLMRAATQAQAAADFLLQPDKDGMPKYLKELERKQKTKQSKQTNNVAAGNDFILSELPLKYQKAIYNSALSELIDYAGTHDNALATAAKNMLYLLDEKLFVLLHFKDGYGRDSKKPEYRNVPVPYTKLYKKELDSLSPKILRYLLEKFEEYQYETAWEQYDFGGKKSMEIHSIVKANIALLKKEVEKLPAENQLTLQLNGNRALNAPASIDEQEIGEIDLNEDEAETWEAPQPEALPVIEPEYVTPEAEPADETELEYYQPEETAQPTTRGGIKLGTAAGPATYFRVGGETGKFLQRVERKPKHSVVITVDGPQGAGKTTMIYQWMQDFADPGNNCAFLSMEEHPESSLATEKAGKYLNPCPHPRINAYDGVENQQELYDIILAHDVIFIDSWQKLTGKLGNHFKLDRDLRQAFNGKVFVIIFQQTTDGKTKGGAEVGFDGDIITKMSKGESFSENYAFFDKNRYTLVPLETIRYNIAEGNCYNPEATATMEPEQPPVPKKDINATLAKLNFAAQ